jgi:hypothetical protein
MTQREENEMYGTTERVIRERSEDLGREGTRVLPAPMEREDREARPYVVRDLSWELARFLETQDFPFPAGAYATPDSANGNPPRPG